VDPYSDAYNAPAPAASESRDRDAPRARSRSRSPARSNNGFRSPTFRRKSPAPKRPSHAPIVRCGLIISCFRPHLAKQAPNPSAVLGVFGLSIRTQERDLDEEFTRFGRVEKVTIVYDQRVRFNGLIREVTNPKPRLLSPTALVASVSSKCQV
jgi:transformer-2 protein